MHTEKGRESALLRPVTPDYSLSGSGVATDTSQMLQLEQQRVAVETGSVDS